MSNTANTSLAQIKKTEEQKANMIKEAQATRSKNILEKKNKLQADFVEAEEMAKAAAKSEVDNYKDEISHEYKNALASSKKEASSLQSAVASKSDLAVVQGVKLVTSYLEA